MKKIGFEIHFLNGKMVLEGINRIHRVVIEPIGA